ncbi:MAG: hypothetical protein QOH79_3106 [Acidimicrobiaceae bacterium]
MPPYHAILVGHTGGGGGGFNVYAECRPGTVVVTVHESGDDNGPAVYLGVSVDDSTVIRDIGPTHDGEVASGPVQSRVRLYSYSGPSGDYRIEYDCRG